MLERLNKKGVSEIISYTLLILIAVSISVLVYSYLKGVANIEQLECSSDISLSAEDFDCVENSMPSVEGSHNLTVYLSNRGLFDIDAVYIRFGESERRILPLLNDINLYENMPASYFYASLRAGEPATRMTFNISAETGNEYKFEVQPAVYMNDSGGTQKLVLCSNAVFTQKLTCN